MNLETASQREKQNRLLLAALVVGAVVALVIIAGFASLFVYIPYNRTVNGPKADATLKDLENEFRHITPVPEATQLGFEFFHKINLGSVGANYRTDKSYKEIRAHYEDELKRNGWRFVKERKVTIWWRDYGGKE